ncbi:MAG: class I SAM-dependent methyltransferase [Lachnospiraceae bacterium]|nr:class I SAM-dependent methyltransferase [Lachnospiraceae bacterium]
MAELNNFAAQQRKIYSDLAAKHGHDPLALGLTKGKQAERMLHLTSDWDLSGSSFLDVGCGFGDFLRFAELRGVRNLNYTGIDITMESIETAKRLAAAAPSDYQINFILGDILSLDAKDIKSDYVMCSGVLGFKTDDNIYACFQSLLGKMWECANIAVSLNMPSDKVDFRNDYSPYYNPAAIIEIAYSYSRRLIWKNDLFPFQPALIIYKDETFNPDTSMFYATENILD